MAKLWLDELVQNISTQADTRAYDIIEKKNKQVIKSTNMLGISFNKAFKYLGAYFGIKALSNYTDEWKDIDSILRLVTNTDEERLNLQNQLFKCHKKQGRKYLELLIYTAVLLLQRKNWEYLRQNGLKPQKQLIKRC